MASSPQGSPRRSRSLPETPRPRVLRHRYQRYTRHNRSHKQPRARTLNRHFILGLLQRSRASPHRNRLRCVRRPGPLRKHICVQLHILLPASWPYIQAYLQTQPRRNGNGTLRYARCLVRTHAISRSTNDLLMGNVHHGHDPLRDRHSECEDARTQYRLDPSNAHSSLDTDVPTLRRPAGLGSPRRNGLYSSPTENRLPSKKRVLYRLGHFRRSGAVLHESDAVESEGVYGVHLGLYRVCDVCVGVLPLA